MCIRDRFNGVVILISNLNCDVTKFLGASQFEFEVELEFEFTNKPTPLTRKQEE